MNPLDIIALVAFVAILSLAYALYGATPWDDGGLAGERDEEEKE